MSNLFTTKLPKNQNSYVNNNGLNGYLTAALLAVSPSYTIMPNQFSSFLLNPTTWDEAKNANWVQNPIPGQSDPILQWVHSGARTVTFDAFVTQNFAGQFQSANSTLNANNFINQAVNTVSSVASKFFNVSLTQPPRAPAQPETATLSIKNNLNYYRSLLYPIYDPTSTKLVASPPLLYLAVGDTLPSNFNLGQQTTISKSTLLWVLTNLRIKVTKQLPDLSPMEAIVSFELMQYSISSWDRFTVSNL